VKKLAVDLYLHSKRTPRVDDDKLRFVRLTRKWLLSSAFGRKTKKRSTRALAAAERLDSAVASQWEALKRRGDRDQGTRRSRRRPQARVRGSDPEAGIAYETLRLQEAAKGRSGRLVQTDATLGCERRANVART
jgi:hypothetical protein